jgi:hypothetical protein
VYCKPELTEDDIKIGVDDKNIWDQIIEDGGSIQGIK